MAVSPIWITRLMQLQITETQPQGDTAIVFVADGGADSEIRSAITGWIPGSRVDRVGPWRWRVRLEVPAPPSPVQRLVVDTAKLEALMRTADIHGPIADLQQIKEYQALPPARIISAQRQKFLVACPYPLGKHGWLDRNRATSEGGIRIGLFPGTTTVEVTLIGEPGDGQSWAQARQRYLRLFANCYDLRYDTTHLPTLNLLGDFI